AALTAPHAGCLAAALKLGKNVLHDPVSPLAFCGTIYSWDILPKAKCANLQMLFRNNRANCKLSKSADDSARVRRVEGAKVGNRHTRLDQYRVPTMEGLDMTRQTGLGQESFVVSRTRSICRPANIDAIRHELGHALGGKVMNFVYPPLPIRFQILKCRNARRHYGERLRAANHSRALQPFFPNLRMARRIGLVAASSGRAGTARLGRFPNPGATTSHEGKEVSPVRGGKCATRRFTSGRTFLSPLTGFSCG
ncbi:hypothetical protein, partial [Jhaorihella thermophila]|uniref:hypothetical protein n=1 Tax=Jhaorihella thermophila TaxID=488547 RepID=UPI00135A3006